MKNSLWITMFIFCFACKNEVKHTFVPIDSPAKEGSAQANLMTTVDGEVYLSWIESYQDSAQILQYAVLKNKEWSAPKTIAHGNNWFVNWADFPAMAAFSDGKSLLAHWLQKSEQGIYDYDIMISISNNLGESWNPPFVLHQDKIAAEHGFVSFVADDKNRVFATWLDGRNTKKIDANDNRGAMTLRSAFIHPDGSTSQDTLLDDRICDCCQSAATQTKEGMLVAYRDRSEKEIRDISIVRQVKNKWSSPRNLHPDNWQIVGCPVNGPALSSHQEQVAVVWFTVTEEGKVQYALSGNNGKDFAAPKQLNENPAVGRVDALYDEEGNLWVSWLETKAERAYIYLTKVDQSGAISDKKAIIESSSSRKSGFPILTKAEEGMIIAWTAINDHQKTIVKTAFINNAFDFSL